MLATLVRESSEEAFAAVFGCSRGISKQQAADSSFGPNQDAVEALIHEIGLTNFSSQLTPWPRLNEIEHALKVFALFEREQALENALAAAANALEHKSLLLSFEDARGETSICAIIRYAIMATVGEDFLGKELIQSLESAFVHTKYNPVNR